jgi:TPR repeat protein
MRQKKNDYYWGLIYCTRNDIENAYFYLNRAAKNGNEVAIHTLNELKEKNLLSNHVSEGKNENVYRDFTCHS